MIILTGLPAFAFPSEIPKGEEMSISTSSTPELTAADVFVNLPVDVLDLLRKTYRLDMVDYFKADSIYAAPNAMEGTSKLVALTETYAKVEITPVSTLEIRLLPMKKGGKRIMTIYSIGTEEGVAADSDIRFFDSDFKEIERKKVIKLPGIKDFFKFDKDQKEMYKKVDSIIPFPTMVIYASPDSDNVTFHLTSEGVTDIFEFDKFKDFLIPTLTYEWDGSKMQLTHRSKNVLSPSIQLN